MVKKLILFSVFFFASLALWAQEAMIFYVNLYEEAVDVRLGEKSGYVFKMDGLAAYESTKLLKTKKTGTYKLYFKKSSEDDYYFWADENEEAYDCKVESGKAHCIVCGTDGKMEYYTLKLTTGKKPQVCFFNGTDNVLSKMEIGPDWGTPKAYTEDLSKDTITNFVSIPEGDFSLYWQFPSQKKKGTYYFEPSSKDPDTPKIYTFANGEYSLFLAYTQERKDYCILYDITP